MTQAAANDTTIDVAMLAARSFVARVHAAGRTIAAVARRAATANTAAASADSADEAEHTARALGAAIFVRPSWLGWLGSQTWQSLSGLSVFAVRSNGRRSRSCRLGRDALRCALVAAVIGATQVVVAVARRTTRTCLRRCTCRACSTCRRCTLRAAGVFVQLVADVGIAAAAALPGSLSPLS